MFTWEIRSWLFKDPIVTAQFRPSKIHVQNFKKNLTVDPELRGCTIFGPKMVHLSQTKFFLEKIINIIFICLSTPFIMQNFKKILTVDPELWECAIFGPKMAHLP